MKITVADGFVSMYAPALDAQGLPITDKLGQELGSGVTMTLDQWQRHARDAAFTASVAPADLDAIAAAISARAGA